MRSPLPSEALRLSLRLLFTLVAVSCLACATEASSSDSADDGSSSDGQASSASDEAVETAPIEEIAASIEFPEGELSEGNVQGARDSVREGMSTRDALTAIGAIAGAPQQVGSDVANWLKTLGDGTCLNLMLATSEGRALNAFVERFPPDSMGAAKCQTYGP